MILSPLKYFLILILKTYIAIKSSWKEKQQGKRFASNAISLQIYFTGVQALPIIILVGLALGTAVIIELSTILNSFGAGKHIERLTIIVLVRELIPIITALIIIGRSGTAMASELSSMKLNHEIELIDSLGINIDYFLVLPRLIGTIVSLICLIFILNTVALGGGFLFAKLFSPVSHGLIFSNFIRAINLEDVCLSLLKAIMFGWTIAMVNCHQGLLVKKSFTEVPQTTTEGVVNSIIICFVFSIIISLYILKVT